MLIILHLWHFCFILSLWSSPTVEGKLEKNEISAEGNLEILSKTIAKDGSFAYVACDPKDLTTAVSCKVVFGEWSNGNVLKVKDKCNFYEKLKGNRHLDGNLNIKIQFLQNNKKAVVSWSETTGVNSYQHVVFVEVPKCTIKYLDFTQDTSSTPLNNLIVYEDKFDVITSDESKCKQQSLMQRFSLFSKNKPKGCRVRFDDNGNPTGKVEQFYTGMHRFDVTPVSQTVAADGFLVYGWEKYEDKSVTMGYMSKSGNNEKLVKSDIDGSEEGPLISTSNTHEKLSLCAYNSKSKPRSKIQCQQFLIQDLAKMNPALKEEYTYPNEIESISVLNLAGKKFMVTTIENDSHPRNNAKHLTMLLHAKGEPSIELFKEKLDSQCRDIELITIEGENSICSYVLCSKDRSRNRLSFYKACVPK